MGGAATRDLGNDDASDIAGINQAIEMGVRRIDTAEMYADGQAETLVGEVIARHDRSALVLTTKFSSPDQRRETLTAHLEASLRRLRTDYVDVYMLHRLSDIVPMEETMSAMNDLVDRQIIRAIGVSNFSKESLARAQSHSSSPIVMNQVHYNLIVREPEVSGLNTYCVEHDVFLEAWRPVRFDNLLDVNTPVLRQMCDKYEKSVSQIAINWLISQTNVTTVAKTRRREHLQENLAAVEWAMDASDIERLRAEMPNQLKVSNTVPLDTTTF